MSTTELQELEGAVTTTAPSGLEIRFQSKPFRQYSIRDMRGLPNSDAPDWFDVPSVSEVLNILDKPGLPWWGQTVALEAVTELVKRGKMRFAPNAAGELMPVVEKGGVWSFASIQDLTDLMTAEKLTVNHVKAKAGARGGNVHDALELWTMTRQLPIVESFPDTERAYVEGLRAFLEVVRDFATTTGREVIVGSWEHGFAGRFDWRVRFDSEFEVPHKVYPKKKPKMMTFPAGEYLIDLKTSKSVYETHLLQLDGYEIASVECGFEPTVMQAVLHVTGDGRYELVPNKLAPGSFVNILNAHHTLQSAKAALKEAS